MRLPSLAAALGCLACFAAADMKAGDECDTSAAFAKPPCESARILKLRTVELAEGPVGGLAPPTRDGAAAPAHMLSRAIYYISLECDGKLYLARVLGGTPGFDPKDLAAAGTLYLRTDHGKVLLKSGHGTEFEAILAAAPSSDASPPR